MNPALDSRARFEVTAKSKGISLAIDPGTGEYLYDRARFGWEAWQAAIASMAPEWISVDERLPETNVEVLATGQGFARPFVTACYYDDERREWYPINTHWTDFTGQAEYPTHWQPLPAPPTPQDPPIAAPSRKEP